MAELAAERAELDVFPLPALSADTAESTEEVVAVEAWVRPEDCDAIEGIEGMDGEGVAKRPEEEETELVEEGHEGQLHV